MARSTGIAVGMSDQKGDLSRSERIDSIHAAILVVNVELDGIEADLNRLACVVTKEDLDRKDARGKRIGLAKDVFGAGRVCDGRRRDGDTRMTIVRESGGGARGIVLRRSGSSEERPEERKRSKLGERSDRSGFSFH